MARPIEFDREQALRDAMLIFWRQGYHKTSVRDLTEATRLQPGSLYGAFSNKRTLFLQSLDYYSTKLEETVERVLHNDSAPLSRIEKFFDLILSDPEMKGCLLVNTLLETPVEDEEVTRHATAALKMVEHAFKGVLEEAASRNELSPGKDPEMLARLLMTGIYGLRVYNKMRPGDKVLKQISESLLSALRQ